MRRTPNFHARRRELGEKIAAIEGMSLSAELSELFKLFDAQATPTEERVKAIRAYFEVSDLAQ